MTDGEGSRELQDLLDANVGPDDAGVVELLRLGEVTVHGRMPWSSNGTFLVTVRDGDDRVQAIYKPEAGERPLWDFPPGLWRREVATWRLARLLGWPVVPPTVERQGPAGVGSVQLYVPARYEEHYFTVLGVEGHRAELEQICVLDLLCNNTDRKGGHVLVGTDGRLWGIDHGLNFHVEPKLRTVMWDFAGEAIPAALLDAVTALRPEDIATELGGLLDPDELAALDERIALVVGHRRFPTDPTGRRVPWPLV